MAYLDRYVDSVLGDDGYDGTSPTYGGGTVGPWKHLGSAATANPGSGNQFNVHVKNNGWNVGGSDAAYRSATTGAVIEPTYGGTSGSHWNWYFNGAPVTATRRIDPTWTLVPGKSNVYRTQLGYSPGRLMVGGVNHWLVPDMVPLLCLNLGYVPSDANFFTWWYSSAEGYTYFCDPYGNPNDLDVFFEVGMTSGGLPNQSANNCILLDSSHAAADYHDFYDGVFIGSNQSWSVNFNGRIGGLYRSMVVQGPAAWGLVRVAAADCRLHYNKLLSVNAYSNSTYGGLGLSGPSANCQVYNNLFYGDYCALYMSTGAGAAGANLIKNNLFVDNLYCIKLASTATYEEDYNAFGLWAKVYGGNTFTSSTITNYGTSGAHSLPPGATASSAVYYFYNAEECEFALQAGSPLIDAGVNLGLASDFYGNPVGSSPDIGPFEFS